MDCAALKRRFAEIFPDAPEPAVCRTPGRVNLIGEHTDYNGLPVLPMTIRQSVHIAFAPRQGRAVRLRNVDPAYPPVEFNNKWPLPVSPAGAWDNYCKAAFEGIHEHFRIGEYGGADLLVAGDIPVSAGLSSSSALVVGCALAYLGVLGKQIGKDITRLALASMLAEAEHYVGTRGGGMDQAIILLGAQGRACKIDFFPLRAESVSVPANHAIVVCNSLVKAAKTGDALHKYNAGPRLCALITALVERQAQQDFGEEVEVNRLGELWLGHLCLTHKEVEALLADVFPRDRMTLRTAASALKLSVEDARKRYLGDLPEPADGFPLKARARHQLTEYKRVEEARDALLAGDAASLGELMNASHASCAKDYEISCEELDRLVRAARDSGAIGARLTGAGFGGCTVNLVPVGEVESFVKGVRKRYYNGYLHVDAPADAVFVAESGPAADYV